MVNSTKRASADAAETSDAPGRAAPSATSTWPLSNARKSWILALLALMMLSNYIDRGILGILAQPLKEDLSISDFQIGLLGGLSFALLYVIMGIPIARLAETRSRVWIITISMLLWSGLTTLCGLATSFAQLFILRVGVGIGEAGAGPPAQSLIADYYPPQQRATALSVFSLGLTLGGVVGAVVGGAIAQMWGWRIAMMVAGVPGLVFALLLRTTTKEPPRGTYDAAGLADEPAPNLVQASRYLLSIPTWCFFTFGAGASNLANVGIALFAPAFLLRQFHLSLSEVGLITGVVGATSALLGTFLGGFLSDLAARRDTRAYAWIGGAGLFLAGILLMIAYSQPTWQLVIVVAFFANVCAVLFIGPILGVNQNLAPPRVRATAVALITVVTAGLGFGLGPMLAGLLSDHFAAQSFFEHGFGNFGAHCPNGVAPLGATAVMASHCMQASGAGIRRAILLIASGHLIGGLLFLSGGRTIRQDLEAASVRIGS